MADKLIRLNLGGHYVDLPTNDLETDLKIAGIDLPPRHIRLGDVVHFHLNDQGRELLAKCRSTDSLVTTNLACSIMAAPTEEPRKQVPGIQHISLGELRGMTKQEGLILQGCGGDPQEWLDGINDMFTEEGILRGGGQFRTASVFEHDGCINILFPMDDVDLDVGKLAMWRLQSHGTFGGTWLSDYLPNRLGIGVDGDLSAMGGDEEVDEAQGFGGMEGMV